MSVWRLMAVATLGMLVLSGCEEQADYGSLNLVDVTGKITLDGQPLPGATVRFEGPPLRFSEGVTDAEGKYRLMYDSNQTGCTPGEKIVRVMQGGSEGSDEGAPVEGADGTVAATSAQAIPAAYNSESTLKADVSATNKTFNFDLKSKP